MLGEFAESLGMRPFPLADDARRAYHAGASLPRPTSWWRRLAVAGDLFDVVCSPERGGAAARRSSRRQRLRDGTSCSAHRPGRPRRRRHCPCPDRRGRRHAGSAPSSNAWSPPSRGAPVRIRTRMSDRRARIPCRPCSSTRWRSLHATTRVRTSTVIVRVLRSNPARRRPPARCRHSRRRRQRRRRRRPPGAGRVHLVTIVVVDADGNEHVLCVWLADTAARTPAAD